MPEFREPPGGGGNANPGWYIDPWGRSAWRWWDGWQWSGWISPPESVGPAVVRQLVVEPTPLSEAPPEAPFRERLPGGAPAGIGPAPIGPPAAPPAGMTLPAGTTPPDGAAPPVGMTPPDRTIPPAAGYPAGPGYPAGASGAYPPPPPWLDAHVPPAMSARAVSPHERRRLRVELLIVLAIFPLPYVFSALQALVGALLGKSEGPRIPNIFPGHLGAGLPFVVLETFLPLAAAALVVYLLWLPGGEGGPSAIGLDRSQIRGDLALILPVFFLCNLIPIVGGGVVLHSLGVKASSPAPGHYPAYYSLAYVAAAIAAGIAEEIVVLGYLVRRLEQLGLRPLWVVLIAVAVRGSYHLYYGWGVLPILAWAAVTVIMYRRYRRLWPFVLVHICWDLGTLLYGRLTFVEFLILMPTTVVFTAMWYHYLPPRPPAHLAAGSGTQSWSGR
jgi:membrane protease YdiL (CAAX protease family)